MQRLLNLSHNALSIFHVAVSANIMSRTLFLMNIILVRYYHDRFNEPKE